MKKIVSQQFAIVLLIFLIFFAAIVGCKKEMKNSGLENNEENIADTKLNELTVKNGTLSFKDAESFSKILKNLSTKSDSEKDAWEQQLGFVSARKKFNDISLLLEAADTQGKFETLLEKYKAIVKLEGDEIVPALGNSQFMNVVDADGVVKISSDFYRFDNATETVVLDGSKSSVIAASLKDRSALAKGEYQSNIKPDNFATYGQSTCNLGIMSECTATSYNGKWKSFHRLEHNRYFTILRDPITYLPYRFYEEKSIVLHFSAQKKTTLGYWNSYSAEYAVNSLSYQDSYGTNINITSGFLTPVTRDWYYSLMFESFGEPYPNGIPPYHPCSPVVDLDCNANSSGTWQAPCSFSFH